MKQIKLDIVRFLRWGTQPDLPHSRETYFLQLPLLQYITRDSGNKNALERNANWYWLEANRDNQDALINDVDKIKKFDSSDPAFATILKRFESGDKYGILVPVTRAKKEVYDATEYHQAFEALNKNLSSSRSHSYFYKDKFFKVIYCYKKKLLFSVVDAWDRCELLLGKPLNYADYKAVEQVLYGDPDELKHIYTSQEYYEVIRNMSEALTTHRDSIGAQSLVLVNSIKDVFENQSSFSPKEFIEAKNNYSRLVELYDAAEGASDDRKRQLEVLRYSFVKQLSDSTKGLLGIDRVGNMKGGSV